MQNIDLEKDVSELLLVGFQAQNTEHEHCIKMQEFMSENHLGGIILFRYNIDNPEQTASLTSALHQAASSKIFVGIDQEGGRVQRLNAEKGFKDHLSAKKVAETMAPEEAYTQYLSMSSMLKDYGFNFNFGPCVDLDSEHPCPVIGEIERSYSISPETVVEYAKQFINAHREQGILTSLKHFPGHGRAQTDSHKGMTDITKTWSTEELIPYKNLAQANLIDSIMPAHVVHNQIDPNTPASISKTWIDKIRNEIGFEGVVVSDCLHMGAIIKEHDLEQTVIKGLNAGLDLLLFSNNPLASGSILTDGSYISDNGNVGHVPDIKLASKFKDIVLKGLEQGTLKEAQVLASIKRVKNLKTRI